MTLLFAKKGVRENEKKIAEILEIKKVPSKPMTFDQANEQRSNPHFAEKIKRGHI